MTSSWTPSSEFLVTIDRHPLVDKPRLWYEKLKPATQDALRDKCNRLAELRDKIARMEESQSQTRLLNNSMSSDADSLESELGDSDPMSKFLEQPAWLTAFDDLLPEKSTLRNSSESKEWAGDGSVSCLALDEEAAEEADPNGKGKGKEKEKEPPTGKKRPFSDLGYGSFHSPFLRTPSWPLLEVGYHSAHTRPLHERSSKRYFTGDPSGSWQVRGADYPETGFETHVEVYIN